MNNLPFVLVHGSWHDSRSWDLVLPLLTQKGFAAHALDLPGSGEYARSPQSFHQRPLDLKTFATEASPSVAITQEERTEAVVDLLRKLGQPAILVGASMGGATISDVAEFAPELVAAVVYSAGFLMGPGQPPMAAIRHESMAAGELGSLLLADPGVTQTFRLDPRSEDPTYRTRFRKAFYHDAHDEVLDSMAQFTHSDEPVSVIARPSKATPEHFGLLPRYYIRCTEDRLMPLPAQDRLIALADAAFGTKTKVYDIASSHCPYVSVPGDLTDILVDIAQTQTEG